MICRNPNCSTNAPGASPVKHRAANPVKCPRCWWPYNVIRHTPEEYAKLRKEANIKPERKVKSCPSCGGINGLHQKGCKV